jgi:hypothetical protein
MNDSRIQKQMIAIWPYQTFGLVVEVRMTSEPYPTASSHRILQPNANRIPQCFVRYTSIAPKGALASTREVGAPFSVAGPMGDRCVTNNEMNRPRRKERANA